MAINEAMAMVKRTGDLSIPLHLRNAPTKLMKELGYGDNYKYAHSYDNNFIEDQFLPDEIKDLQLYKPGKNLREEDIRKRLQALWKNKKNYNE